MFSYGDDECPLKLITRFHDSGKIFSLRGHVYPGFGCAVEVFKLVARAIHDRSPRCQGPFIKVNCSALDWGLLESELFGYVKGGSTDAGNSRICRR